MGVWVPFPAAVLRMSVSSTCLGGLKEVGDEGTGASEHPSASGHC